jgi:hypothetical protein
VVAKWTGDLDNVRLQRVLNKETGTEADETESVLNQTDAHLRVSGQTDGLKTAR